MPYPSQIDRDTIVAQALTLVEVQGAATLTLGKVAAALGVKAPSLYRYVDSKAALIRAVNEVTLAQLFAELDTATDASADPEAQFLALALAYRRFAHAHPQTYVLAFTTPDERPDENLLVQMVLPIQRIMAQISGDGQSLAALRGALALIHGFVMLELNRQLQRGGDLDLAFAQSVSAYLAGWRVVGSAESEAQPMQMQLNLPL